MTWASTRLGDVCTLKRGYDLPETRRVPGDVPVVSSSGITGYHNEKKADAPGVVTGRYGTLGEVHYIGRDYWPLNTALYVREFKGNHPRFISYFLQNALRGMQSDKSAVPGVNRNDLHDLSVRVPRDRETQERIADVLAAYDDLIENDRRRMALLEETARLLHREWFVRLRFSGYQRIPITNGVPEGWERKTLGELCREIRNQARPDDLEPDTPYIGLEHIPRRSITLSSWGRADEVTSTKHRFQAGDIIFGKIRPYFHKVGVALVDGVASSDAIVIRPVDERLHALVLLLLSSDEFVAVASKTAREGSKMPRADWNVMQQYPVPVAPNGLLAAFSGLITPILRQLRLLAFQKIRLRSARDLLLPRLMAGEIEV